MSASVLYQSGAHRNILLEDLTGGGLAVQANHHVIADGKDCMILDPGGHKVFNQLLADLGEATGGAEVRYLFLSHQDPDIVAATNGWLMITEADALLSTLWTRFVPHFGIDQLLETRLKGIPDGGTWITLGESELAILPAHFLHSPGNFHVYDPQARILYSGDLGASLGAEGRQVHDFDAHVRYMLGFHRRYMASGLALKGWVRMVRQLDVEIIAPQHGAYFAGQAMVARFLDWCEGLACGVDLLADAYKLPDRSVRVFAGTDKRS